MKLSLRRGRGVLAAVWLGASALAGPAGAADATPEQIDLAKKILVAVGLKASMDEIVPAMLSQLQGQLLQIHPEMGKALHETLVSLVPEFQKNEEGVFTDTARALGQRLSASELQQTLTYFQSDAGKKYTDAQAPVLDALGASGAAWRQKLTVVMLDRTREEMKKKGYQF